MQYLFDAWASLEKKIFRKFIFLFFDYDGTLTPIVATPQQALIPATTKNLLKVLAKKEGCRLFIVSGRRLKDVKSKVGIKGIVYAGNHGFEIQGPQVSFKNPIFKSAESVIRKIRQGLKKEIKGIKGAFVEDKGATLSLHYRLVAEDKLRLINEAFNRITEPFVSYRKIRVTRGKKVFEVRPPLKWDKGRVILWLLARPQFKIKSKNSCVFYIGDDITDEDAFRVLANKGITIFVGRPKKSFAKYYLKDTREVAQFMHRIERLLN